MFIGDDRLQLTAVELFSCRSLALITITDVFKVALPIYVYDLDSIADKLASLVELTLQGCCLIYDVLLNGRTNGRTDG